MGCGQSSRRSMTQKIGDETIHVICIVGPAAAGKGTQCERIIEHYGLAHVCVGEILHDHVKRHTELGAKAKPFMESNELVPVNIICDMLQERLAAPDVTSKGCLLDDFPLILEEATSLLKLIEVDLFILLDVPADVTVERIQGRRLDPQTGAIYHSTFQPPPPDILSRLVSPDHDTEDAAKIRLQTWNRHTDAVSDVFAKAGKLRRIDGTATPDDVFKSICSFLDAFTWDFSEFPYSGHMAFEGRFCAKDAKRARFFHPEDPPFPGDEVVSFSNTGEGQQCGVVSDVEPEKVSDGTGGLLEGNEGTMVTVSLPDGKVFYSWSVFLAPNNDMVYSSVCTTAEFQSSSFCRMYPCLKGVGDADPVPKAEARIALQDWLQNLRDSDGEPLEMFDGAQDELFSLFDTKDEASLYLYTTHRKIAERIELAPGKDYSLYFRALNNTLNNDNEDGLRRAMPLLHRMMYLLLYQEDGERRLHAGGRVWKGDSVYPVPLNMLKLRNALYLGTAVRFRQFQSTTIDENLARKYTRREDTRGFLWIIDIPHDFWGARNIADVAWKAGESETLFPPYAAFRVQSLDDESCHLLAIDRSTEIKRKPVRHGLRGTHVELLNY